MIKTKQELNIIRDNKITFKMEGKLLRINTRCTKVPEDVSILCYSNDGEMILNAKVSGEMENHYPINQISSEIEIEEGNIMSYPLLNDYFYIDKGVQFKVLGLKEGESIDSIKIVYEYTQEHD
jgi:hypothetical protein